MKIKRELLYVCLARERERERERECVCVCVREREMDKLSSLLMQQLLMNKKSFETSTPDQVVCIYEDRT